MLWIVTDFDEVIAMTDQLKSELARQLFGIEIPPASCREDRLAGRLSVRQYRELIKAASSWEFGLRAELVPGAVKYIGLLQEEGNQVSVVTARTGERLEVARALAESHGLSLSFSGVGRGQSKIPALRGCHIFIEDMVKNLAEAEGIVPYRFLLTRPHNHADLVPRGVIRVSCWCTLYERVHELMGDSFSETPPRARAAIC